MNKEIERILITEEQLEKRVCELGAQISKDYVGKDLFLITVLRGSMIFAADLMRAISVPVGIDFMAVSSYGQSSKTSGVVRILKDLDDSIEGKDILILEDIIDSGMTLKYLQEMLSSRGARSVKICTILSKPERRQVEVNVDYIGFEVPDEFLVGYGLDYAQHYRNLPYVGVLSRHVYEK